MFRDLRRLKSKMSDNETFELLINCKEGVLGTIGDFGYPYTVVVNYVYYQGKIYFHCADEGHKIDNIKENDKISFTVYDNVLIVEREFTTKYKSVTLFGRAKVIPGNKIILMELLKKYTPNYVEQGSVFVEKDFKSTTIVEIEIEHITGKSSY